MNQQHISTHAAPGANVTPRRKHVLRQPRVQHLTGLPRSSMYAEIKKGTFPRPVKLSARAVGWLSDEIEDWLQRQIDCR